MEREIPYDLFEEYLQGILKGEELEKFELQLQEDASLKEELELYKSVRTAQANKPLNEFENLLETVQTEYAQEETVQPNIKKSPSIQIWRWAAVGLLLLGLGLYFTSSNQTQTPEVLYAEYAKHDFSFQELSTETDLTQIQNSLKEEDYESAISKIKQYLIEQPNAAEIKLAKGIALLETNQFDFAKTTFQSLGEQHPLYKSESDWYQALTYLKQKDINQCRSFLSKIPNSSSRFTDTQKLLNALK